AGPASPPGGTRRVPTLAVVAVLVALAALAAACGSGSSDAGDAEGTPSSLPADADVDDAAGNGTASADAADSLPEGCSLPPVTLRLEAGGPAAAGGPAVTVSDAVAVRVPILPGADLVHSSRDELIDAAGSTPLALYSLFLADFPIDRSRLGGFTSLKPGPGQLLATLSIVPTSPDGFHTGDVADTAGDFAYETVTTFAETQLVVLGGDHPGALAAYDDAGGEVRILHLDEQVLCVDIDLTYTRDGEMVYAGAGVVAAPVLRANDDFFFT
ncbi:MAG: hypothetical protein D6683_01995, partial [Actinomyces sp.]